MVKLLKTLTLAVTLLLPLGAKAQSDCSPMALPYTCGFETNEIMGTTSATALPLCSQRYVTACTSGQNNPHANPSSPGNARNGSRYLSFIGNVNSNFPDTAALILPQVDVTTYPMSNNRLSFWARMTSSNNKYLYIATMSDRNDMSTLTVVDSVMITGTSYSQYFVPLTSANATDDYVVMFLRKASVSGSIYMDDLVLEVAPSCNEITGFHCIDSLATSTSLTLAWNASGADSYKVYRVETSGNALVASGITDTFLTVNTLDANTYYSFAIHGICGSDSSAQALAGGRTSCTAIAAPYTWTFDDMGIDATPSCWSETGDGAAYVVNDGESQHSGSNFVRFSGGVNNILVLPELTVEANTLQLKFWTRPSENSENCGTFSVGYLTDASDASTFVVLETYSYSDFAGYEQHSVMYNNAPAGARMAMRHTPTNASNGWWYVDDVTIEALPSCIPVSMLTVSDLTSDEATLNWQGTASAYSIYQISGQDTILYQNTTDAVGYLFSLQPQTTYTFGVVANCGTDASEMRTVSFTTPCAVTVLPYTETFETNSPQLGCWSQEGDVAWSFATGDFSESTGAYEGTTNATTQANNYTSVARLISPVLNANNATGMKVSFAHIQRDWAGDNDELRVLYRASLDTVWTIASTYSAAVQNWTVDEVTVPGNTVQVAFEFRSGYGYGVGIDSVVFAATNEEHCFPVTGLHVVESLTSTDSLVLSWNGNNQTVNIIDMSSNTLLASEVEDTFYVLRNLTPATYYTIGVVVDCFGSYSDTVTVNGRTLCGVFEAPYTWDFESTNANAAPDCWEVSSGTVYVENGSSAHAGSNNLRFRNSTNNIIVLPAFTTEANTLQMSLWLRPSNNTSGSGTFHVGYVTNPGNASTFTAIASYPYSEFAASGIAAYGQRSVSFADVPAGARIALRAAPTATYFSWLVDDVEITSIPDCMPVTNLTAVDDLTTSESVTLTWGSEASGFIVYNLTDNSMVDITNDTTITIDNLTANTDYTFGVATDCGTDASDTVTITVHTACEAIAIPYTENFESDGNFACWRMVDVAANTGLSDYSPLGGEGSGFRFAYNSNPPQYLISPELSGTEDGIQVSFMYKTYGVFPESFALGYSTTTNEPSAFIWSAEQTDLTDTVYQPYSEIYTAANIKYIAIKYTANNQYYLFIDSLVVREIPSCMPVSGLAVDSVGTSTVSLSWNGEAASYTVLNGNTQVASGITDTHYTVTSLNGGTEYTFSVIANCSATDASDPVSISATTEPELHVTFAINDATMGTIDPAPGTYDYVLDDTVRFSATANSGYRFVEWILDGGSGYDTLDTEYQSAYVPASTWMDFGNVTLTAVFEATAVETYTIDARSADETMGYVTGGGEYTAGAVATLEAIALNGYRFVRWDDGNTNYHREVTVSGNQTFIAYFESAVGIDDVENGSVSVHASGLRIVVAGARQQDIYIYSVDGRCVRTQAAAVGAVEFTMDAAGVYMVKVGDLPAKRVVTVR